MKLKALDQIHISSVKPDSLRPGEEFEVGEDAGKALLKQHPSMFRRLDAAPANKAKPPPKNKKAAPKA